MENPPEQRSGFWWDRHQSSEKHVRLVGSRKKPKRKHFMEPDGKVATRVGGGVVSLVDDFQNMRSKDQG